MKMFTQVFCLIFGHNKILESKNNDGIDMLYTICSQCQKKWFTKKLSSKLKINFKNYTIKMRGQGQKIIIKPIQEEPFLKKQKINFYTL